MDSEVYKDGWPRQQGWYECLVDGELKMMLKYYVCQVSMKRDKEVLELSLPQKKMLSTLKDLHTVSVVYL